MTEAARILVVLPTLGQRLDTLEQTLSSIQAQSKTVNLRLAVVIPSNAIEARSLASSYGAILIDDPGTGISGAINAGIMSRNDEEFYAWMGDDDLFRPNGLLLLQQLLDSDSEAIVAYGGCDYIDPSGRIITTSRAGKLAQFLLRWGPDLIPHPGSMIRMTALEEVGLFDENLKFAMDLDLFLRLQKHARFTCSTQTVSAFRWHPDSITVGNRRESSRESEYVKARHLPTMIRPLRFAWTLPVRWASAVAAQRLNKLARASLR